MPSYAIQPGDEALLDRWNLTESYTQAFWRHAKQLAKGAAVLGTGMLGYGLWRYAAQQPVSIVAHRNIGELTPKGYDLSGALDEFVSDSIIWNNNQDSFSKRLADHCLANSPLGEFQINTYTSDAQWNAAITSLIDGSIVVVWQSYFQGNDPVYGVRGQRFGASGVRLGSEFKVNTYTAQDQKNPKIIGLTDGSFVAVWQSNGQDGNYNGIYGQRYTISGVTSGSEFRVNSYTLGDQMYPDIAALLDGSFVVVWQSNGQDSGNGFYGQRYAISGAPLGGEFQINNSTGNQYPPAITSLTDGSFVVVWQNYNPALGSYGIYGQHYNISGGALGDEFKIITKYSGLSNPIITGLMDGGFVVAWLWYSSPASGAYAQHYAMTGTPLGSPFQISSIETNPSLAISGLSGGGFVAVWADYKQVTNSYGVYGQRYGTSGIAIARTFQINTYIYNYMYGPDVNSLPDGGFVVVWTSTGQDGSDAGVYGQRYQNTTVVNLLNFCDIAYIEDTLLALKVSLSRLVNEPNQVNISLSLSDAISGQLGISITPAGVITSFNVSSGIWQAYGDTLSGIITALGRLTFSPTLNYNANVTISAYYSDNFGNALQGDFLLMGQAVNDMPVWANSFLPISQGENKIIDVTQLLATDVDNTDSELVITVSQVQHGQFEHINQPGIGLTNFTQQNIKSGEISFRHDDLTFTPSFALNVTDGQLSTSNIATVDFNLKPSILNNVLVVQSLGEAVPITTSMILATDNDNSLDELVFTVGDLKHGHFEVATNVGKPATHFTQEDIVTNLVQFFHDGSHYPPSYTLSVSDGRITTTPAEAGVSFNVANKTPYTQTPAFKAAVSLGVTAVGGLIGYAGWQHRKKQDTIRRREKSLIGTLICEDLNLSGINNFDSENGERFIDAITRVTKDLEKNHGIDVMAMTKAKQKDFAHKLAVCLKPYASKTVPVILEADNNRTQSCLHLYSLKVTTMINPDAYWLDTEAVKEASNHIAGKVKLKLGEVTIGSANNHDIEMQSLNGYTAK